MLCFQGCCTQKERQGFQRGMFGKPVNSTYKASKGSAREDPFVNAASLRSAPFFAARGQIQVGPSVLCGFGQLIFGKNSDLQYKAQNPPGPRCGSWQIWKWAQQHIRTAHEPMSLEACMHPAHLARRPYLRIHYFGAQQVLLRTRYIHVRNQSVPATCSGLSPCGHRHTSSRGGSDASQLPDLPQTGLVSNFDPLAHSRPGSMLPQESLSAQPSSPQKQLRSNIANSPGQKEPSSIHPPPPPHNLTQPKPSSTRFRDQLSL